MPCGCYAACCTDSRPWKQPGGFQINTDADDSFTWMIDFIDHGLQATTTRDPGQQRPSPADAAVVDDGTRLRFPVAEAPSITGLRAR